MDKSALILLFSLVALGTAEVIDNIPCNKGPDSRNIKSEVHEIRVSPCTGADEGLPCEMKKGSNATIEIDFTPTVSARRLKAGMFWMSRVDLIFRGLKTNACLNMPCPLGSGNRYTYSATIPLGRDLPAGQYPIKLKVSERRNIIFCQTLKIKLVEPDNDE